MNGTNIRTGKSLVGDAHLRQSVEDILTTPVGTRVLRRDYGSRLPSLVDNPQDEQTRMSILRETAGALARHEPRLLLIKATVRYDGPGEFTLTLEGKEKRTGQNLIQEVTVYGRNRQY